MVQRKTKRRQIINIETVGTTETSEAGQATSEDREDTTGNAMVTKNFDDE